MEERSLGSTALVGGEILRYVLCVVGVQEEVAELVFLLLVMMVVVVGDLSGPFSRNVWSIWKSEPLPRGSPEMRVAREERPTVPLAPVSTSFFGRPNTIGTWNMNVRSGFLTCPKGKWRSWEDCVALMNCPLTPLNHGWTMNMHGTPNANGKLNEREKEREKEWERESLGRRFVEAPRGTKASKKRSNFSHPGTWSRWQGNDYIVPEQKSNFELHLTWTRTYWSGAASKASPGIRPAPRGIKRKVHRPNESFIDEESHD